LIPARAESPSAAIGAEHSVICAFRAQQPDERRRSPKLLPSRPRRGR